MNASRGEIKIREILENAGFRFTMEQSFEGLNSPNGRPLRFDFCVFDDDDNIDFLCFGHTHNKMVEKYGTTTLINPGTFHRDINKKSHGLILDIKNKNEFQISELVI